jgi:hypothetical protein
VTAEILGGLLVAAAVAILVVTRRGKARLAISKDIPNAETCRECGEWSCREEAEAEADDDRCGCRMCICTPKETR